MTIDHKIENKQGNGGRGVGRGELPPIATKVARYIDNFQGSQREWTASELRSRLGLSWSSTYSAVTRLVAHKVLTVVPQGEGNLPRKYARSVPTPTPTPTPVPKLIPASYALTCEDVSTAGRQVVVLVGDRTAVLNQYQQLLGAEPECTPRMWREVKAKIQVTWEE